MDLQTIIGTVVAFLTPLSPYLTKAGESLASEIGKATLKKGQELYGTLCKKAEQEKDKQTQQALALLGKEPQNMLPVLQERLAHLAESDPAFAQALSTQVDELCEFLFECLQKKFLPADLKQIYFRLDIGWDDLVGEKAGKSEKVMSLIEHVRARERMPELVMAMWQVYPGLKC